MICHIGKPLAARGLLCLAVVNSGGKPCHGCRTSLCGKTGKIGSIQEFSILSCSFDLSISFQEGEARKFPVHCAVHLQPLRFAVRLSRGFSGGQWLCCSTLGSTAHSSRQHLLTFHVIYHHPKSNGGIYYESFRYRRDRIHRIC